MQSLKERFTVKSYESDRSGLFKLFSFMNHAQELAGAHAIKLGFGYDDLIKSGNVWILSRFHAKFFRIPKWREELEMETWHKGNDKLFGYRDFLVTDSNGIEIITATSSWIIINSETRRIQRIETVLNGEMREPMRKDAIKEPAARLTSPPDMTPAILKTVSLSDLDMNKHTNNAKYVEWALDVIKPEIGFNMTVKEMWINFNNESLLGEQIQIFTNEITKNLTDDTFANYGGSGNYLESSFFVEGKRGNSSVFQFCMNF